MKHTKHYRPHVEHMSTTYSQLGENEKQELTNLIQSSADMALIRTIMYNKFHVIISNQTIQNARTDFMAITLKELGVDPTGSACDRLLSLCKNRDDISFVYVTHTIDSGFVTMKKFATDKDIEDITKSNVKNNTNAINKEQIESWRNCLKVGNDKESW